MQHHAGQRNFVGLGQGFAQQGIDLATAFIRRQVVGRVDVLQRDLLAVDKGEDIDGLGRQGMGRADLFFTEHHIAAFFILHTFDDVLFGDFLAGHLVDALITHRVHAAAVQPVEIHPLGGRRRDQRHGNMHQPETDRAFPDCPCHGGLPRK
ncbi:hypothetical protein D3C76_429620 [compost metagenome]